MSDLHDFAAPYALNALDDAERDAFELHLDSCSACRDEVALLLEAAASIGLESETPAPASMKGSVMERIGADPVPARSDLRQRFGRWILGGAAAAVVALAFAAASLWLNPSENPFQSVVAAPDAVVVELPATDAFEGVAPAARVAFSASSGDVAVEFIGLPDVAPDETYEAWIIEGGSASPAGLFRPDDGKAVVRLTRTARSGALVGVTIEPAAGSLQPTGEVLFLVEL